MSRQSAKRATKSRRRTDLPGVALEKTVARIQQMMDPNSTVSHNEKLIDRVGNERQYDVVIRGRFAGRDILGVIECKDQNRKKGPAAVEAFSKKTENLNANIRMMVSRKGFTKQALNLAKHEGIACLSLLPDDPRLVGFSIGDTWYGRLYKWVDIRLVVHFAASRAPITSFSINSVKWKGSPVIKWFTKELLTTCGKETQEGDHSLVLKFDRIRNLEIEGKHYKVKGLTCIARRSCERKKKWVSWTGDALYDWNSGQFTIPPEGTIVSSTIDSNLTTWEDYDGDIPEPGESKGFLTALLTSYESWNGNEEVADLSSL